MKPPRLEKAIEDLIYSCEMFNGDLGHDPGIYKKYTLDHLKQYVQDMMNQVRVLNTLMSDKTMIKEQQEAHTEDESVE